MNIENTFQFIGRLDDAEHRTCSICGKQKRVTEFYKDGKYRDGSTRRRRDCKECYKATRFMDSKKNSRG